MRSQLCFSAHSFLPLVPLARMTQPLTSVWHCGYLIILDGCLFFVEDPTKLAKNVTVMRGTEVNLTCTVLEGGHPHSHSDWFRV